MSEKDPLKNKEPFSTSNSNPTTKKQEEDKKKYIRIGNIEISEGMIMTYIYLLSSIVITINNRFLYQKYNFKFNFTLMFMQQSVCSVLFYVGSKYSQNFQAQAGEISFKDFLKLKEQYAVFSLLFGLNILSSFYGNQLVINTAMFLILRKFLAVMTYLYDIFIEHKKLESYFTISILLITTGSIISGLDDFTYDLIGYIVVFINNALSVIYAKVSEKFRKKNGISNVKLLIYNSFIITPVLLIIIIISGEGKRLLLYLETNKNNNLLGLYLGLISSCILCLILNSSYFFSNEKNSSLFTQLFGNCRDILVTGLSMFTLRDFVPTFKTIFGLILSTFGALFFSMESIIKNMKFTNKINNERKK